MSATAPPIIAGRYELQRRLAQGGMAEVWLAIDLTLDRRVAVKWLKPTLAADDVVAERFRREAIAAASLNHPNIVAVHDVFEQDGRQAVVMQLIDGKSLRQLLDSQNRLSPALTCHIGACVAAALDHAHRAGFVHRDVKPGNIMITPDGRVLLTDFGIAKGLDPGEVDLTHDNIMMGTAKYLSPEQVRGRKLDGRADLYSLGLVLYECLAGRVPFLGQTDADTALARLQRDPTDLARLRATLPTGLVSIVHQLLARNPNQRPATGEEVEAALRAAADEPPPQIDPTEDPASRTPSAGRLRRAPSDHRGQAKDRERRSATPPATPRTTGSQPVVDAARTTGSTPAIPGEPRPREVTPVSTPAVVRDETPPNGTPGRGRPAKGLTHRRSTSLMVIGGVIAVALVASAALWATIRFGAEESSTSTTVLAETETTDAGSGGPTGPVAISAVAAFDPDGDGTENDAEAQALATGGPAATWSTVCYADRFMGGKRGVGVAVSFNRPTDRPVVVDVQSAPYQMQFYASTAARVPRTLDDWGAPVGSGAAGGEPAEIQSPDPAQPVRHVLALFNELGPDQNCTAANPYRGTIGQIRLGG